MIGPSLPPGWKQPTASSASPREPDNQTKHKCSGGAVFQVAASPVKLPPVHLTWKPGAAPTIGCGLRNLGNSCYLNSVLQCLAYLPPLGRRCLINQHSQTCSRRSAGHQDCAACILEARLYRCLQGSPAAPEGPVRIWKNLHLLSRELQKGAQEDAHEALRGLVEAWNRDSLRAAMGWTYKPQPKEKEPPTPITQLFGGELQSQVRCLSCGHESNTVEVTLDLSLEVNGCKSIQQALQKFMAAEKLDGDNKYRCDRCKRLVAARKQMMIRQTPHCLVIHLKRFDFMGGKLAHAVAYGETLSLSPFLSAPPPSLRGHAPDYRLTGVVVHEGSTRLHGHYHAMVRDGAGSWHDMDDSSVTPVARGSVLSGRGYLLFYCRLPDSARDETVEARPAEQPSKKRLLPSGPQCPAENGNGTAPKAQRVSENDAADKQRVTRIDPQLPASVLRSPLEEAKEVQTSLRQGMDGEDSKLAPGGPQKSIWQKDGAAGGQGARPPADQPNVAVNCVPAKADVCESGHEAPRLSVWGPAGNENSQPKVGAVGAAAVQHRPPMACTNRQDAASKDHQDLRARVREWCLLGPMAESFVRARQPGCRPEELLDLRHRVREAASHRPCALLGTKALKEAEELLLAMRGSKG